MPVPAPGPVIVVGGNEDKTGAQVILRRFVALAGGSGARLMVLTTAAADPVATGDLYRRLFLSLGAAEVTVARVDEREEARSETVLAALGQATGIYFTGGDQLRITATLGGTPLYQALMRRHGEGLVIAGTSAGASAVSDTMIIGGREETEPTLAAITLAPGLGLLRQAVVDQHFAQRGRIGRLLAAVAQNPQILGLGIDEDTAMVVYPEGQFTVLGTGAVTVLDGQTIEHSNASEAGAEEPLALTGVRLHILPAGYGFDLAQRRAFPPAPHPA